MNGNVKLGVNLLYCIVLYNLTSFILQAGVNLLKKISFASVVCGQQKKQNEI